jgi:hypothetical protein
VGNAAIYYYPEADGNLVVIDLGEPLSDMQAQPVRIVDTNVGQDLEPSTVDLGGSHRVRVVLERFTGASLVAQLRTFESHALRGLPFGVVSDTALSWAGFALGSTIDRDRAQITTGGTSFFAWSAAGSLTAGDVVVIHSANPEYKHEQRVITGYSATTGVVTFGASNRTVYSYEVGPIVVRHRDFLPVVYLDPGARSRPILTHDHRINYTLDLTCLYSPAGMASLYSDGGGDGLLIGTTADGGYPEGTLQGIIGLTSTPRDRWGML